MSFIDNINKNLAGIISQIKNFPKPKTEQPLPGSNDDSAKSNTNVSEKSPESPDSSTGAMDSVSGQTQPQTIIYSIYNDIIDKYNNILNNILKKKSGNLPKPDIVLNESPVETPVELPKETNIEPQVETQVKLHVELPKETLIEPKLLSGSTIITTNDRLDNSETNQQIEEITNDNVTNKLEIKTTPSEAVTIVSGNLQDSDNIDSSAIRPVITDNDGLVKGDATIETKTNKKSKKTKNLKFIG